METKMKSKLSSKIKSKTRISMRDWITRGGISMFTRATRRLFRRDGTSRSLFRRIFEVLWWAIWYDRFVCMFYSIFWFVFWFWTIWHEGLWDIFDKDHRWTISEQLINVELYFKKKVFGFKFLAPFDDQPKEIKTLCNQTWPVLLFLKNLRRVNLLQSNRLSWTISIRDPFKQYDGQKPRSICCLEKLLNKDMGCEKIL